MHKHLIAGFDIGTSKIRCILYDLRGNIKFISSLKTPIIKKSDGYYYNPCQMIIDDIDFIDCTDLSVLRYAKVLYWFYWFIIYSLVPLVHSFILLLFIVPSFQLIHWIY